MSSRLLITFFLILVSAGGLGWYYYQGNIDKLVEDFEAGTQLVTLTREVITPPPLRGPTSERETILTADGVFVFTNEERVHDGKAILTRNTTLNAAAENKLQDMFQRQYFEHESPTGEGPADVVEAVGYDYLRVGENLALGNFESDRALVTAWMNSPGHRANILSAGYTEIGIAVGQGTFEGARTWLAVQTFATPASVCPTPTTALKTAIDTGRARLDALDAELEALSAELDRQNEEIRQLFAQAAEKIEAGNAEIHEGNRIYKKTGDADQAQPHWDRGKELQEEGSALREEAQALAAAFESAQNVYNTKVAELNTESATFAKTIEVYNTQVQASNACAETFAG